MKVWEMTIKTSLVMSSFFVCFFAMPEFGFKTHISEGRSMFPKIRDGETVLVSRFMFNQRNLFRGDVVKVITDDDHHLVKRVIGLPGETIEIKTNGIVFINGIRLLEPYATLDNFRRPLTKIPEGHYYVLGDNRGGKWDGEWEVSYDSRMMGPVPESWIKGVVCSLGTSFGRPFLEVTKENVSSATPPQPPPTT